MTRAKQFSLPFIKKQQLTKDVSSFYFDRTNVPFDFLPGQYIQMVLPHEFPDVRGTSRYFTIASSPLETDYLMVTTKLIQSTFKETFYNLAPGQDVSFFGPMGKFVFNESDVRERVFIAGGMGITPFRSILHFVSAKKIVTPITLFVSFAAEEAMLFYEELMALARKHTHLNIIYTISDRSNVSSTWRGEKERISELLLKKYLTDVTTPLYSVVGSPGMVAGTRQLLQGLQIPEENILSEDFTGY